MPASNLVGNLKSLVFGVVAHGPNTLNQKAVMSKNPHGGISRKSASREWGSKARKRETTQRNLNNRAANEAIAEQIPECPVCSPSGTGWNQSDDALVAQYGCPGCTAVERG